MKKIISYVNVVLLALLLSGCTLFQQEQYTITFETNGGSVMNTIVFEDASFAIPEDPVRESYAFDGWYLDSQLTIPYNIEVLLETPLTEDITLYAKWTLVESSLTLSLKYIYQLSQEADVFDGTYEEWLESVRGPEGLPGEDGEDGRELVLRVSENIIQWQYQGDTDWTDLLDLSVLSGPAGASAYELYLENNPSYTGTEPEWLQDLVEGNFVAAETYTITFEMNGGDPINPITDIGFGDTLELPTPTYEGYTFNGWYTGNTINDGQFKNFIPITEDRTLYAQWIPNIYTITYMVSRYENMDSVPIVFPQGEEIVSISAGRRHSLICTNLGRVFSWGHNGYGQLGDGTTIDKHLAVDITSQFNLQGNETITDVHAGYYHSLAITSDHRVFSWGYNVYGQVGNDTVSPQHIPVDITSQFHFNTNETITSVSLGEVHTILLTSEGRVFTWGRNVDGQLGDGTNTDRHVPTVITSQFTLKTGDSIVEVFGGNTHSAVLTSQGDIFMWGYNRYGQVGDGTTTTRTSPVNITNNLNLEDDETIKTFITKYHHSAVITSYGRLLIWGMTFEGDPDNDQGTSNVLPTDITNLFDLTRDETLEQIVLGSDFYTVITSRDHIYSWGYNKFGQLGTGDTTTSYTPINITNAFEFEPDETIVSMSPGLYFNRILTSNGTVYAWGRNQFGQIGNNTLVDILNPTLIIHSNSIFMHREVVEYGTTIPEYDPFYAGYTFDGWYTDIDLLSPFTFLTMPAYNVVLRGEFTPSPQKIAMITDGYGGGVTDSEYDQFTWESIESFATTNAILHQYYIPTETSDDAYLQAIELAIQEGATIIVTSGFRFETSIYIAQDLYPSVNFLLIDGVPHNPTYSDSHVAENTQSILFKEEESGFLAGYAAVMDGYRNLGFTGGMPVPAVREFGIGYIAGAYYAAEELGVTISFGDDTYHYFDNFEPSLDKESLAFSWYATGTEIIFSAAGYAGASVIEAAEDANATMIGVDLDQASQSSTVLTSALKRLDPVITQSLQQYIDNAFIGGTIIEKGAEYDAIGLPMETSRFVTFTQTQYDVIYEDLVDDTIYVPRTWDELIVFLYGLNSYTADTFTQSVVEPE